MQAIREAWRAAQSRRPYKETPDIITALTPPGGAWSVEAAPGAICRSIKWGSVEVAYVNPAGALGDSTEGDIAMGLASTPIMDTALRAIIVLAERPENLALIREMAVSAIAYVERPAPEIREPEPEDEEDDGPSNEDPNSDDGPSLGYFAE